MLIEVIILTVSMYLMLSFMTAFAVALDYDDRKVTRPSIVKLFFTRGLRWSAVLWNKGKDVN